MMPQPIALVLALAFVASVSGGNIYYRLLPKGAQLDVLPFRIASPHPANTPLSCILRRIHAVVL